MFEIEGKKIFVCKNIFDDIFCDKCIDIIYNRIINGKNAEYLNYPRSTIDKYTDKELADSIFNYVKKHVELLDTNIVPNDIIFTSRYNTNGEVGIHLDDKFKKNSKYTVLVYLNDDYIGGTTEFYNKDFNKQLEIIPKKGDCIIFDLDLYHSGSIVTDGIKYIISIDLLKM